MELTEWLKSTIPGIIILGAIGSVIGALAIWLLLHLLRIVGRFLDFVAGKVITDNFFKLIWFYVRQYFVFRSLLAQLTNKSSYVSLSVLHTKLATYKLISAFTAILTFCISYFLFLLLGTEYPKSTAFFVAAFFLSAHDAIMCQVLQVLVERKLFGYEYDVARGTYKDESILILDAILSWKEHHPKLKKIDIDKVLKE